jgi:hypothetical protein
MAISIAEEPGTWTVQVEHRARRLAAVTWAGALIGLVVGGVGSRVAMLVLARLNPQATGVTSDDGFTIGQLTTATFNLLAVSMLIGVLGGGIYLVLRGLMLGPRWFQVASVSLGPAVVVGSMLVHVEGVDYTVLDPAWLAIVMFVTIPGVYAALLTVVAERWLLRDSTWMQSSLWLAVVPLLLWVPLAPFLVVGLLGVLAFEAVRRTRRGAVLLARPALPWLARGALAVLFAVALVDLVRDTVALV